MKKNKTGIKFFIIKSALKLLLFIDYLGNLPQKIVKTFIKLSVLAIIIVFFLTLLTLEKEKFTVSNFLKFYLFPQTRFVPNGNLTKYPLRVKKIAFPKVSAHAIFVKDLNSNQLLFSKNINEKLSPASTTKLMTALVAYDLFKLNEYLVVPEECTRIEGQKIGFLPGEVVMVNDLIYSLLIFSSGDSACTLAYGAESYGKFIGLMNKKSQELGAKNTNFVNPVGLDDINFQHYSSASDLNLIAEELIKNELLREVVKTKEFEINSGLIKRHITNTNKLLSEIEGSVGIKTGRTFEAKEVLIYQYKKDNIDLMIIVMGSDDRFLDTAEILKWTMESYKFGSDTSEIYSPTIAGK